MTLFTEETWRLLRGTEPVGEIRIDEADFPWLRGEFAPGPGWAEAAPRFAETLRLVREEEWGEFDRAYAAVERDYALHSPDGPVAEFLLHIDPPRAWFRFSEEPFEDD
ncbi:hypothetical protein [Kitasatospora cineracea]|uniref:Uncharacterized protein n=2 Tax=Kitasatospora cineracea TaxID=88074 RepID=A0A3N4RX16_9ACTN|nr:hypothetical protein [Kitasatospora cineracea]RPE32987.1 hypothetical protein EDD38_1261 [Kitasatospora cineracea]